VVTAPHEQAKQGEGSVKLSNLASSLPSYTGGGLEVHPGTVSRRSYGKPKVKL
jgi:hypothetical protein